MRITGISSMVASLFMATSAGAADDLNSSPDQRTGPVEISQSWVTTVTHEPQTAVKLQSLAGFVAPASVPLTTGSLTQGRAAPSEPRLNGKKHALSGVASFYWQGLMTASGERFNRRDLTAAHPTLSFGTHVRVTRVDNGRSVIVRINDRGPFKPGRVIDLSERAAEDLGMTGRGLAKVSLDVVSP